MRSCVSLLVGLLGLCGCADRSSSTSPASDGIAGVYHLQTVNGAALPYLQFSSSTETDVLSSGSVQLNADGSYFDGAVFSVSRPGTVSTEKTNGAGTYVRSGEQLTFTEGPVTYTATITGSTITFSNCLPAVTCPGPGLASVYAK